MSSSSSTAAFDVNLLGHPTASSFSVSPDYAALVVIILIMALTVVSALLTLHYFSRKAWTPAPPSSSPPPYKLRALQEGLQLLQLPKESIVPSTLRTTDGIQPLPELRSHTSAFEAVRPSSPNHPRTLASHPSSSASPSPPGASSPTQDPLAPILVTSSTLPLELTDGTGDVYLHELSSQQHTTSLDGFDLGSATSILQETKASLSAFFAAQSASFAAFYDGMHHQLDHVKQLLAVKLSVTLNKSQHGFLDSMDRLVSGELLARQACKDMHRRLEDALSKELEELVTSLRNLSDTYEVFPIKHLMKAVCHQVDRLELLWRSERSRRKQLAAYTPIVGKRIVEALAGLDVAEEPLIDGFLSALLFFHASASEVLQRLLVEEANHASAMEKIDESNTQRKDYELDRYHLQLMKTLRDLQTQLSYLDEKTTPLFHQMRAAEQNAVLVWAYVQGPLMEERWGEVEADGKGSGGLWRGINSELAKVLSGLLGMKGGLEWEGGRWRGKAGFDPTDPFCPIFDPGFMDVPADDAGKAGRPAARAREGQQGQEQGPAEPQRREESRRGQRRRLQGRLLRRERRRREAGQRPRRRAALHRCDGARADATGGAARLSPGPSGRLPLPAAVDAAPPAQRHPAQPYVDRGAADGRAAGRGLRADRAAARVGREVVEVLSAWRAAREVDHRRGSLRGVSEQWQQKMDQLRAILDQISQAKERHAAERQALEAELLLEGEEEHGRLTDAAHISALIERAMTKPPSANDTAEEKEVRALVEQGVADPAMMSVMLMEEREKAREGRMTALRRQHEAEMVDLQQRERKLSEERDREADLKQRLEDVRQHDAASLQREQETAADELPEVVTVTYTGSDSESHLARILRADRDRLAALNEEHEERAKQSEAAWQKEVEELEALRSQLSPEEFAARQAALQAEQAVERDEEEVSHRALVQQLVDELSARCVQRLGEHEAAAAEQQRSMLLEEKEREAALLAGWEGRKGGRAVGAVVNALMRRRQQRELERLMDSLSRARTVSLTRAIKLRRAAKLPVDVAALQQSIRQAAQQSEVAALRALEHQHRGELQAAFAQCGGEARDEPLVLELKYDEVEDRSAAIADCMDRAQAESAADVEEAQQRILNDEAMTDEQKAVAIEGLLASLSAFDERVAREQQQQSDAMQRKLDAKRRKKDEADALKTQGVHGAKDQLMQEALRAQQEQQATMRPAPAAAASTTPAVAEATAPPPDAGTQAQLDRIEGMVRALHADALSWRAGAYTDDADARDPRFLANDRLTLVPLASLTPAQAFLHRFGQSLLHLLHSLHPIPHPSSTSPSPPSLLLASSLPPPPHSCCALHHVLAYDSVGHALCVRVERLEDVGRFVSAVVHGAAHLGTEGEVRREVRRRAGKEARKREARKQSQKDGTGEEKAEDDETAVEEARVRWEKEEKAEVDRCWDDRDARFQRRLHRLHAAVMADLFFASNADTAARTLRPLPPAEASQSEAEVPEAGTLAEAAMRDASASLVTLHPLAGSAAAVAASSPALYSHLPSFSAGRLLARLSRYSAFAQQSELLSYLAALERQVHTRDHERRAALHERLPLLASRSAAHSARWSTEPPPDGAVEGDEVDDVEDELNARLAAAVQQWWPLKEEMESGERAKAEAASREQPEADEVREERERLLEQSRWKMAGLMREKDEIMARLRHCQHAREQQRKQRLDADESAH